MESKNEILNRLRQTGKKDIKYPSVPEDKILFADYPQDTTRLVEIFCNQLKNLSGEVQRVSTIDEAADTLIQLIKNVDPGLCQSQRNPLIENLIENNKHLKEHLSFLKNIKIGSKDFAKFKVGITGADYLIARTGSIFLRSNTAGGRRLSVLPPTHIVVAREKQIVYSLNDVLANIKKDNNWSYATFITGPSRTSDIEKQLVLGAHGPKRLVVLLIKD